MANGAIRCLIIPARYSLLSLLATRYSPFASLVTSRSARGQPAPPINANPRRPLLDRARGGARHGACSEASSTAGKTRAAAPPVPNQDSGRRGTQQDETGLAHEKRVHQQVVRLLERTARQPAPARGGAHPARRAPERGDIEPGAIRNVLGDSFIIAYDPEADHPFRLAGTRVCALFGRELKGEG